MGLPATPLVLLLLLLPLTPVTPVTPPVTTVSPCLALLPNTSEELDLSDRSHGCAELDWSLFHRQRRLKLRHNGIRALSPSSRVGPGLEELDLAENHLRELPRGFFANATALRRLWLEGNPLPAVPPAAFQPSLSFLSVSCRCDVVGTILTPCTRPGIHCLCLMAHQGTFNVTAFHSRECGLGAGLVAGVVAGAVAAVVVLVAVGAAAVWYRRRRAGEAVAGVAWGKQDPAGGLRQPRYVSRDPGIGTADGTDGTDGIDAPDYENVFVSRSTAPAAGQGLTPGWQEQTPGWQEQRYSPQLPADEDYFLDSAADPGDQPIYANTLGRTEDIYIVPDQ